MITSAARGIARAFAEAYVRDEGGVADPQPSWEGANENQTLLGRCSGSANRRIGEVIGNEHVWQGPYRTCIEPIRLLAAVSSHVALNSVGLFSA